MVERHVLLENHHEVLDGCRRADVMKIIVTATMLIFGNGTCTREHERER